MLPERTRRLCRLFSAIVLADWDEVGRLRRTAPPGEPDRAWREALLMVHVFAGFPRSIEAYDHLAALGGLGELEPDEHRAEPDLPERGAVLFGQIYGARAAGLEGSLQGHHPDFAGWVAGHAYGRVLTRPGLDPVTRELLAVSALASLGQERQLAAHARGAVRCGATPQAVASVVDALADGVEPKRRARAHEIVTRFAVPDGEPPASGA